MIAAPYYVALVQIDSGPLIEVVSSSRLDDEQVGDGKRVGLVLEALGEDEDGEEIAAYRFVSGGNEEGLV